MSKQIAIQFSVQALSFDGVPVHFNNDDYLNATNIAAHFGKRVGDYLRNVRTQDYIKALGEYLSETRKIVSEQNQLVIINKGGDVALQGTWIHPKLAVDFARWLSPKFAVWCDVQIEKILGINEKYHGKRTTKDKRTALHEAIALLMTKSKYLHFKDCYKIVHQRFNVNHLDEIAEEDLPKAVEYVHSLVCGNTEPHIHAVLHDHNVQFLMWYVPKLAKFIKNEVFPALVAIQSNYAGRLSGLTSEVATHANILNRKAIGYGVTHLEHVNDKPVHTTEWYLSS